MQREKPPEWREKQKGSRGIRRGQRYRLVFQFPIREQPDDIVLNHDSSLAYRNLSYIGENQMVSMMGISSPASKSPSASIVYRQEFLKDTGLTPRMQSLFQVALVAPENVLFFHSPIQLYCAKQKVEFYLTARKICISLFYHSYIFIQTINFFLIIMIKVLIVNRCRVSGMEGGTPLFHMIPE